MPLRLPKPDSFLLAMLSAVVLALLFPAIGASSGPLHLEKITQAGVSVVFFLHGAALSRQSLHAGVKNWRLHVFVQACTYLLFPLIGVALVLLGRPVFPPELLLGLFYLCALSSTLSSSVAMTAMAHGNVAGAIFNATLSSLLGMVLTPFLVSLMASTSGHGLPWQDAVLSIALQLMLPFGLGQLMRPLVGGWLGRHKRLVHVVDRGVIVLIVYSSFCDSTQAGLWSHYHWQTLAATVLLTGVLLLLVLWLTTLASRALGFSLPDEIAAVFCGSKKSLATGIPIAKLLFGAHPSLGLIVLPIMFYHQIQLLVCTVLARRYAARVAAQTVS